MIEMANGFLSVEIQAPREACHRATYLLAGLARINIEIACVLESACAVAGPHGDDVGLQKGEAVFPGRTCRFA